MSIKVLAAFSNSLFSEGVARLLDGDDEIKVDCIEAGGPCLCERLDASDVILTDFAALYSTFPAPDSTQKHNIILFDTDCGKENILAAITSRRVSGVLMAPDVLASLKKAIQSVASGETWIDSATVKEILLGVNQLHAPMRTLSEKEREVAALTGMGLRNREIAERLNISEPTVKTHLHRIFKKLNIRTRSQLVTYSMRSGLMNAAELEKKKGP